MICGSIFTLPRNQIFTKYRVITWYCLLFIKKLAKSLRSYPGKPHLFCLGVVTPIHDDELLTMVLFAEVL